MVQCVIPKLKSIYIHLSPLAFCHSFSPSPSLSSPCHAWALCKWEFTPNFRERDLPKSRMWSPKTILVWRCIEDWEFKVWQWLNSQLPWWPFQYLSTANLLKSFYSPLLLHIVPHQLGLDYLSLYLVRQGTCSPQLSHTLKTLRVPPDKPISPLSLHFRSPSLTRKGSRWPFQNLHCTPGSPI